MPAKSILPHLLAVINVSTIVTLSTGYYLIKSGQREAHRKCMLFAMGLGVAFMVLYLSYHLGAGLAKFGGVGLIRPFYFTLLILHILAAAIATPLVPIAFWRAWTGRTDAHRKLAPWAWKVWMFVATSGIAVYVMTIHVWPYTGVSG
jgi:putative membrane protein